jgi:hypothetical protein
VAPDEERIRDAWSELENGGSVSFDDFSRWWKDRKVTYVVKRGVVGTEGRDNSRQMLPSAAKDQKARGKCGHALVTPGSALVGTEGRRGTVISYRGDR